MDENSTELMDYNSDESDPVKANSCQVFMHIDDVNIGKLKIELQTHVPHENLSDYEVWLQNSKKLDQSYRLADDCTTSGLVQIDVEISFVKKQTTIRDVIQPSEEMIRFNEPKHVDQSIDTNDVACVANFMEKLEGIYCTFSNYLRFLCENDVIYSNENRNVFLDIETL